MDIFSPNFLYKIKLLGYTVNTKKTDLATTKIYLLSHDILYKITYHQALKKIDVEANAQIDNDKDFSVVSIYTDGFINFTTKSLRQLLEESHSALYKSVCGIIFRKSDKIYSCGVLAIDFETNKVLIDNERFVETKFEELEKHIYKEKGVNLC